MGNPLKLLEGPLESFLVFLNHQGGLTIGWAIIALTLIVRLILLPLFISQYRSARRMQEVAPLIKELQKRHKNDKRRQQEEMMKLFQEHKVNPFGSCLPIVFQAPIFIALYFVLRNFTESNEIKGTLSFMGIIPDVSMQFRDLGWRAVILALIYGTSQLLATEVGFATSPQTSDMQRKIFRVLPLFIVGGLFIYPNVPSGLILYWLTTNLWTCGQQVVLKRRLGPLQLKDVGVLGQAPVEVEPDTPPKPRPKPKSKKSRAAQQDAVADTSAATSNGNGAEASTEAPAERPADRKSGTQQSKNRQSGGGSRSGQRRRPPRKR